MAPISDIICSCLMVVFQLKYIHTYKPPMLNLSDFITYPDNYTFPGTTVDSLENLPAHTACGKLTFFEAGTMRREEEVIHAKGYHSGSVIILHGLDGTGKSTKEAFMKLKPNIELEHIRFIFPTAPLIQYTPANKDARRAWFDDTKKFRENPEREPSLQRIAEDVKEVIRIERDIGIPLKRIIVGGFSMGAAMAMYLGYKDLKILNGVFALSQWHHSNVSLFEEKDKNTTFRKTFPSLFYGYGGKDRCVIHNWGRDTLKKFCSYGIDKNLEKEIDSQYKARKEEIDALWKWISEQLPELDTPPGLYDEEYPAPSPTMPLWTEIGQKLTTMKKHTTVLD